MSATVAVERVPWTPPLIRVMAGLMISLFVAALDTTVVGTALPTISRELGSFKLYPWIIAGYLITATTTVSIWGRLADIRGRRVILLVGVLRVKQGRTLLIERLLRRMQLDDLRALRHGLGALAVAAGASEEEPQRVSKVQDAR